MFKKDNRINIIWNLNLNSELQLFAWKMIGEIFSIKSMLGGLGIKIECVY